MFKKLLMISLLDIIFVPDILLENVKIKMKLVLKYNWLEYAENYENLNPKRN